MLQKYPACAFCGNSKSTKTVHHTKLCETKEEYENLEDFRFEREHKSEGAQDEQGDRGDD